MIILSVFQLKEIEIVKRILSGKEVKAPEALLWH